MKRKVVNIGIIGCGWIAEYAHIPALLEKSNVNLLAVFDREIERTHALCKKYMIPYACSSLEEFLECGLDGVIISTPNDTHFTYSREVLKRGIGVLCEKPVAKKTSEMEEIIRISKENNAVYVPGFVNRWRQDIQVMYQAIKQGELGNITAIDAGWLRKSGVPRPGTWFTSRKLAGGGVLTDLGSHVIDLCLMFIGGQNPVDYRLITSICKCEKVNRSGAAGWLWRDDATDFDIDVEESATADILFEEDTVLHVELSWRAPIEADCTYFNITGTKGKMELKTLFGFSNERLWKEDQLIWFSDGKEKLIQLDKELNNTKNAFGEMISYFVEALLGEKTNFTNYQDAYRIVSLTEKLYGCEEKA